jgi:hypothetical protein
MSDMAGSHTKHAPEFTPCTVRNMTGRATALQLHTQRLCVLLLASTYPTCRSFDYLLDLLVLRAFQTCLGASGPGSNSILSGDQPAALDAVLQSFLHLAAGLPTLGVVSWEYLYSQGTVQQAMLRPELAAVLRPAGFEGHPIVLDPADPTNNVTLALSQDGLTMLAAAARSAASTPVTLLKQIDSLQQQLEALRLQQQMLLFGGGTWELTQHPSVSNWLPLVREPAQGLATLTDTDAPGLSMRLFPVPLQHALSTNSNLMGVELRLSEETGLLKALSTLPIPVTLCRGSQFIVQSRASSVGVPTGRKFATVDCIELDSNISGKLGIESGVKWVLSRDQLHKLGLCAADARHDVSALQAQAKAGCTVKFKLVVKFEKSGF